MPKWEGLLVLFLIVPRFLYCLDSPRTQRLPDVVFESAGEGQQPTVDALRHLASKTRSQGVFGVEELLGESKQVYVSGYKIPLGSVLDEVCKQDPRYHWTSFSDPRMINVLSVDENSLGARLLRYRIPEFNLEVDDFPWQVLHNLPYYSPELRQYLATLYVAQGGKDFDSSDKAFSGSDLKPPHFSLHLKNVSVLEILNAISLQTLDNQQASGYDRPVGHTMNEVYLAATSWLLRLSGASNSSFVVWSGRVFSPLR